MAEPEAANQAADEMPSPASGPPPLPRVGVIGRAKHWLLAEGPWWLCSFVFHLALVCSLAMLTGNVVQKVVDEAPSFQEARVDLSAEVPQDVERFEVSQAPEDPTELNTDTLSLEKPAETAEAQIAQEEKRYDDSSTFTESTGGGIAAAASGKQPNLGGLGGFDLKAAGAGPSAKGRGGVGVGVGSGAYAGTGGDAMGFGSRGSGSRKAMLGSGGGTRQSELAVHGALNWIARHQSMDGSWSLTAYQARCKDPSCASEAKAGGYESAATALALLPFFGAGQTHESKGRYQKTIRAGVLYLIKNQKPDGDLRMGTTMYAHGLASLALCECFGMSNDKLVGRAAQAALNFIMQAQDPAGGGWRYAPRDPGDTSVTGWQIMALKSGQMAYLTVNPAVFERAKAFLKSVSPGNYGGSRFSYMPGTAESPALTAVGLLCEQYMHVPRTNPAMIQGTAFLMQSLPDPGGHSNLYYWYYATQVMHNQPGPDWDAWNRKMRRTLIDAQCKDNNCANGSWSPKTPQPDDWGGSGGRLYMTSLAALTLEVYYRYLPLYKLDRETAVEPAAAAAKPAAEKPADKGTTKATDKKDAKPATKAKSKGEAKEK
jgi:hypothetical protein